MQGMIFKDQKEKDYMAINILGTKYRVYIADKRKQPRLDALDADGYMDQSAKEIVVGIFVDDAKSIRDLKDYTKKVLRHEIIHAFLYESGLWNNSGNVEAWGQSEEITDWIAIQFPKILKVFKEVDAL